jgi:formate hydrogenlyase subunit 4
MPTPDLSVSRNQGKNKGVGWCQPYRALIKQIQRETQNPYFSPMHVEIVNIT